MKKITPHFFIIVTLFGCSSSENSTSTSKITAPELSTVVVTNITQTAATSGGVISNDRGANITSRGVIWNTSPTPTTSLSTKTTDGTGTGNFTSSLANLNPSTTYYVRAYATNSEGTSYGNEISFKSLSKVIALPTVTTANVLDAGITDAISGGNVTNDGGTTVTARGVVWSTSSNPTVALNTKTLDGTGIGSFESKLSSLSANTDYYVRAYATNSLGTAYGNEIAFKTLPLLVLPPLGIVDGDGNVYQSIKIGEQEWLTENLKTTKYCNGESIPKISFSQWGNLSSGAYTYYDDNSANASYGKLYNWYVATSSKNACPCGWRVSTREDWSELAGYLGYLTAAIQIKSTGTIEGGNGLWYQSNTPGNNSTKFNALPAGWGDGNSSSFKFKNYKTGWWCSGNNSEYLQVDYNYADFYFSINNKNSAMSIRCIKN